MAGKAIDNLSIIISANTRGLAKELAQAAQQFEQFNRKMERQRGGAARPRGPDGLPVLEQWRRGGRGMPRFGAEPGVGGPFGVSNRERQRAQYTADRDRLAAERVAASKKEILQRQLERVREGLANPASRYSPERQALIDKMTAYKPRGPGLLRRTFGSLWGSDGTGRPAGADKEKEAPAAKAAKETERSFLGVIGTGMKLATGLAAVELGLSGVAGGFMKVKESVAMAGELEQTTLAFEVMTKSAERARTLVADIRRFAASTPFQMGELQGASRQLLAYGIAADQVMPTLRMLGDVSAAFGKDLPIRDLTYLYGTLHAQQRAYAIDVRQFGNRGVPIYEELAKVVGKSSAEVKQLIEDGRISSREVTQAFINMTTAGGRFYQMTERQGKTFLGQWEQMVDAFRLAQIAFGGVLIEELGLAEATRDLQAFAQRLEQGMGVIRPAVRFVGDLAKGTAQLAYEFTRAGIAVASINLEALDRTFPGIRQAADSFHQLVIDAKDFKFDDEKLVDFGAGVAETMARTFGSVADYLEMMFKKVKKEAGPLLWLLGKLQEASQAAERAGGGNSPAARDAQDIRAAGRAVSEGRVVDAFRHLAPQAEFSNQNRAGVPAARMADNLLAPDVVRREGIPPVVPGMTTDRVRAEYAALTAVVNRAEAALATWRGAQADEPNNEFIRDMVALKEIDLRQAHHHRGMWVHRSFPGEPGELTRQLNAGEVPRLHAGETVGETGPQGPSNADRFLANVREVTGPLRENARKRKEEAERQRMATEANRATEALNAFRRTVLQAGPPLHDLGMAALREDAVLHAEAGLLGAAFVTGDRGGTRIRAGGSGVRLPEVFPHLEELTRELRKEYDPRQELELYRRDLDMIRERGMLGEATGTITDRAWTKKVQEQAARMGIGQRVELPSAVDAGSADDARLINAWRSQPQTTTDQLLQQIEAHVRQMLGLAQNIPVAPPPRLVRLPGD